MVNKPILNLQYDQNKIWWSTLRTLEDFQAKLMNSHCPLIIHINSIFYV